MAKRIQAYGVEDECDVMVVRRGPHNAPAGLYRATKITEKWVVLGYWYKYRESEWVAYPAEEIKSEDVLCVVESVEEYQKLNQERKQYREQVMVNMEKYIAEIYPIKARYEAVIVEIKRARIDRQNRKEEVMALEERREAEIDPIRARYDVELAEMQKTHEDRLNRLLGVKVF